MSQASKADFCLLLGDSSQLVEDSPGSYRGDPGFRFSLSLAHPGFRRLLGDWLISDHETNPFKGYRFMDDSTVIIVDLTPTDFDDDDFDEYSGDYFYDFYDNAHLNNKGALKTANFLTILLLLSLPHQLKCSTLVQEQAKLAQVHQAMQS